MFILLQGILWNGERTQVAFVCSEKHKKKKSPVRGRLSPAAAAPVTNTGVMTLGHLIKSAALGPATPYPGVTASFFN